MSKLGKVGPYTLLERLGRGGMGEVYLATVRRGERVAVKVLHDLTEDDSARIRLEREVRALRRVESPYVARVLDADLSCDRPYLVMEHIEGPTLLDRVRQDGAFELPELVRLAQGIAAALAIIHAAGVVHRDLKPGNIIMGADGPVLIDFGIAQVHDATRLTMTGTFLGTPGYTAPEIFADEQVDSPADVHAWAATVAFAATGRPAFGRGTAEAQMYAVLNGQADLKGVPVELLPLVRAALNREPRKRPTAALLADRLARLAKASGLDEPDEAGDSARLEGNVPPPRGRGSDSKPSAARGRASEVPAPRGRPADSVPPRSRAGEAASRGRSGDGVSSRSRTGEAASRGVPSRSRTNEAGSRRSGEAAASRGRSGDSVPPRGRTGDSVPPRGRTGDSVPPRSRTGEGAARGRAGEVPVPRGGDGAGRAARRGEAAAAGVGGRGKGGAGRRAAEAAAGRGRGGEGAVRARAQARVRTPGTSGKARSAASRAEGATTLPAGNTALLLLAVLAVPCVVASVMWPVASIGITAAFVVLTRALWMSHWMVRNRAEGWARAVMRVVTLPFALTGSLVSAAVWPGVPVTVAAAGALWITGGGEIDPETWWQRPAPVTAAAVVFGMLCGGITGREIERVGARLPDLRREGLRALAVLGGFVALCAAAVRAIALLL